MIDISDANFMAADAMQYKQATYKSQRRLIASKGPLQPLYWT